MVIYGPIELVRLIKNARKKLGKKYWKGELKFNSSTDPMREFILDGVGKLDCQIAWASFEKTKLPSALLTNKHLLYMTACEVVLWELFRRTPARKMNIMMDKYYSKKGERDRSDEHVKSLLVNNHAGFFVPINQVSQYDSQMKKELQVHDFVVGAIFQHIERGVDKYMRIIEDKVVFRQER